MLKIKQYVKAESLEQAYELNQKKTNRIVGGMLWLKMSTAQIQTAIDLSGLGLDQIEETEDAWKIGCMVSLRDLELHEGLNELSCNMIRESVRSIVGVQFRNLATKNNGTRRTGILFKQEEQQPCTDDLSGGILPEVSEGAAGTGSGRLHLQ